MSVLVLLARLLLVVVFGTAGIAKFADREGARRSIIQFGLPVGLASRLAWTLIVCELIVAVALLLGPSARAGALAALVLLASFSAAIAVSLLRGQNPVCHCFGRLQSKPVGWSTEARNGLLVCAAAFVVADGRLAPIFGGLALLTAGLWAGLTLYRRYGRRLRATAPDFSLQDQTGRAWTPAELRAPHTPLVLVFSNPACNACSALLPIVASWQEALAERVTIVVVSGGPREHSTAEASRYGLRRLLVDEDRQVSRAYGVTATPSAVLIDGNRAVATASALGAEAIAGLIARVARPNETPRLARRTLLKRAAFTAMSASAFSAIAAACGTSSRSATPTPTSMANPPAELEIDGAWLCDQRFALCTDAPCEQSPTDPNIVNCRCVVRTGYSVGFKSCTERAPVGDTLHSNFSTLLVTSTTRTMTCPSGDPWGNCLDVICEVDPLDPERAVCQCVRVDTGVSVTFGGNCDTQTCSSVIWSAASPDLPGSTQLETGMQEIGQPITLPQTCPST